MIFKPLCILMLICGLIGCTTVPQSGLVTAPGVVSHAMATDSANRLVGLYPPARTRFQVKQPTKDAFGVSFMSILRQKGYSMNESADTARIAGSLNLPLYYLVDEPSKGRMYRVTLVIGNQSLSRAYALKNGVLTPLGFWVRKE